MPVPNGLRTVLLLAPALLLLLPLSALVFILERAGTSILSSHATSSPYSGDIQITLRGPTSGTTPGDPSTWTNTDVILDLNIAPVMTILGVCVIAFMVSILGVCGLWELRKVEGSARRGRVWSWSLLVANAMVVGICVGVLAWTSAVQGSEKGWQSYADVQEQHTFTRETWVCGIEKFYPSQDWAGTACGLAKATRFMLIPVAVAAALVILSTWIFTKQRGGLLWLRGGKGRYGGFDSMYEMTQSAPLPYANAQPGPYQQQTQVFQPAPYGQPWSYGQHGQAGPYVQAGPFVQQGFPLNQPPQGGQAQAMGQAPKDRTRTAGMAVS